MSEGDRTRTAVARWGGGWRCDVDVGGFGLVVDEPVSVGGGGEGPSPTDLLLASLCSCYALSLSWAARKRGVSLPDLEVEATGTYDGPRFASLLLTVRTSLPSEQLEPLLETARRVCYVSNTVATGLEIIVQTAGD